MSRVREAACSASAREASAPGRSWFSTSAADAAGEDVAPIEIGLDGGHGAFGGDHVEKRRCDGRLDVEPRERFACARLHHRRLRARHGRFSQAEIEGLPRKERAGRASPDALPEVDGSTGPDIAGITDCGRTWPKMLFAVARLDCHIESSLGR